MHKKTERNQDRPRQRNPKAKATKEIDSDEPKGDIRGKAVSMQ